MPDGTPDFSSLQPLSGSTSQTAPAGTPDFSGLPSLNTASSQSQAPPSEAPDFSNLPSLNTPQTQPSLPPPPPITPPATPAAQQPNTPAPTFPGAATKLGEWMEPTLEQWGFGKYDYKPFDWLKEPQQIGANAKKDLKDQMQGWQGLGALANKAVGDVLPPIPTIPQDLKMATPYLKQIAEKLGPQGQMLAQAMEAGTSQVPGYQYNPKNPIDLPMIGSALKQSLLVDPFNQIVRPMLHGQMDAPIAHLVREPLTAAMDYNIAAGALRGTRLGRAAGKGIGALKGRAAMTVAEASKKLANKQLFGFAPLADHEIAKASKLAYAPLHEELLKLSYKQRKRRRVLAKKYHALPKEIKDAIPAAMAMTDSKALEVVKNHPAAIDFIKTLNNDSEDLFRQARKRGMYDDETWLKTRLGPQYMAEAEAGKRGPVIQEAIANKADTTDPFNASSLKEEPFASDLKKFASEMKSGPSYKINGRIIRRTGKSHGGYVPLVAEGEAESHMRNKPGSMLPNNAEKALSEAKKTGAFKERQASTLQSPNGYTQLSFGAENQDLVKAFCTRAEQLENAIGIYDVVASGAMEKAFLEAPPAAQRVLIGRLEKTVNTAMKITGSKAIPEMDKILLAARDAPLSMTQLIDILGEKLEPVAAALSSTTKLQRQFAVKIAGALPIIIAVQQGASALPHALGMGGKGILRAIIASVIAKDKRLMEAILPEEFLEKHWEVKSKWNPDLHPHLRIIVKGFQNTMGSLSKNRIVKTIKAPADLAFNKVFKPTYELNERWHAKTTDFTNYWRTITAVSHMLYSFESLPPEAQKFMTGSIMKQLKIDRSVRSLLRARSVMEGGRTAIIRHAAEPIQTALKKISRQRQYQNKRMREIVKMYNSAQKKGDAGKLERLDAEIAKIDTTIQGLNENAQKLTEGKKPIYKYRLGVKSGKTKFVTHYNEARQVGQYGVIPKEAQRIIDELHKTVDELHGRYDLDRRGKPFRQFLQGTILWDGMMFHATTLLLALYGKYGIVGDPVNRLIKNIKEMQEADAHSNNLSALTTALGGWVSNQKAPDGTHLVYYPFDWFLMTQGLKAPEMFTHWLFPGLGGKFDESFDMNWILRMASIINGKKPGTDYKMRNPEYYSLDNGEQANPEHLRSVSDNRPMSVNQDVAGSPFAQPWEWMLQGTIEGFSEKTWSFGKNINRLLTGHEPGDIFMHPKRVIGKRPDEPLQQARPVTPTGLFSSIGQPITERISSAGIRKEASSQGELEAYRALEKNKK